MDDPTMPIAKALLILAAFHTRDDSVTGFVVEMYPAHPERHLTPYSQSDYVRAWEAVRAYCHLPINPQKS